MKIGIVLSQPPSYSEIFFNLKIKGLLEQGYTVELYVRQKKTDYNYCKVVVAPKVNTNSFIQIIKTIFVFISLLPYLKRVLRFIKLEKSSGRSSSHILKNVYTNAHLLKADLDWLHFGFATMALKSEHVAKSIGAKMAVSCRGYDMDVYPLKHSNCYHLVWENVDKVHAISKYILSKAHQNGLAEDKLNTIIFPAVQTELLNDFKEKKIDKSKPVKIRTIARLHWIKGLNYTLEALAILKEKNCNFFYEIIGSGPEYESLRFAIHQLGLDDNVGLVGEISHQDALIRLEDTDIYIQYSQSEGFCNAVLEAQAKGCLCIVSDGGALSENILDGETGWVVPWRNSEVLAQTISKIINMDNLVLNIIRNSTIKRVLSEFTINNQIKDFIDFYE